LKASQLKPLKEKEQQRPSLGWCRWFLEL